MGVFPDAAYEQGRVAAGRGDRLVLFTDGITEVLQAGADDTGPERLDFGEERLAASTVEYRASSASALLTRLSADVSAFSGSTYQDDATLMVLAID